MKLSWVVGVLAVVAMASAANAAIINWDCDPDTDGNIANCQTAWSGDAQNGYTMAVTESMVKSPGHLVGYFETNTAADPTVTFLKSVTNNTTYAWSGYRFNMYMDQPFTIGAGTTPIGWTATVSTGPTGTYYDSHGKPFTDWAMVDFTNVSGSNIGIGNTGMFGASVSFDGFFMYTFELEQIAAPEPATLALVLLGSGLFFIRRR